MCPHCQYPKSDLLSHSYNRGSTERQERRCTQCATQWEEGRTGIILRITIRGATHQEAKRAALCFASAQHAMIYAVQNGHPEWCHMI